MNDIDLKLKLFSGDPIETDGYGLIYPLTVRDIIRFGYSKYMQMLNIICLETRDFIKDEDEELMDIDVIDILIAFGGEEIGRQLEEALSLFLKGEAIIDKDNLCVIIKFNDDTYKIVNNENFGKIKETIKWLNYVNNFEEKKDGFNPANEEARKLKERMEKLKRQKEEIKRKKSGEEENSIDFFDIISSLSSKSFSVSEFNVLDLTIYQVYRKFKRIDAIDQYDISIKSIMAGGKTELKHWSSKLD